MELTGTFSRPTVDEFLATTTVPVRLGCRTPEDHPWMLSLWYLWDADCAELCCATSADADVVRYLAYDDAVSFEISTNDPPYRGVRGRGTASVEPDEGKQLLRTLLERYLGDTDSPLARRLLDPDRDEVRIRIAPARLHSWDYSGRMKEAGGVSNRP